MGGGGNVSIISAATETEKKYKDAQERFMRYQTETLKKVILSRVLVKYFNPDHLIQVCEDQGITLLFIVVSTLSIIQRAISGGARSHAIKIWKQPHFFAMRHRHQGSLTSAALSSSIPWERDEAWSWRILNNGDG